MNLSEAIELSAKTGEKYESDLVIMWVEDGNVFFDKEEEDFHIRVIGWEPLPIEITKERAVELLKGINGEKYKII